MTLPGRSTGGVPALFGMQALVEYGALNSLARDASMTLQRLGGWATRNWIVVAVVLGVVLLAALRPKR